MHMQLKKYIVMVLAGILISLAIHVLMPIDNHHHNQLHDLFLSIFLTIVIWEGNLYIDKTLNKKLPWESKIGKRILAQFIITVLFCVFSIYLCLSVYNKYVCAIPEEAVDALFVSSILIGTLFSILILSIIISIQFFTHWKNSLVEVEKHKTESVKAQLQNLKNQINPHFLFNNLSVLSALVYKDPDKSVEFINQLSKVYRYLLDNRNQELITLEDELTFLSSYNYLLQIRFDTNIVFKMEVGKEHYNKLIPPLALQMLIENAIKHNEISSEKPLIIHVYIDADKLIVSNNLQLRSSPEPSSKTGLQNCKDRYKHFTDREIEVTQTPDTFVVKLPLLNL